MRIDIRKVQTHAGDLSMLPAHLEYPTFSNLPAFLIKSFLASLRLEAATAAGRDPAAIGMEGRVTWTGDADRAAADLAAWQDAGATHVSVNTMGAGLRDVESHLDVLERLAPR